MGGTAGTVGGTDELSGTMAPAGKYPNDAQLSIHKTCVWKNYDDSNILDYIIPCT